MLIDKTRKEKVTSQKMPRGVTSIGGFDLDSGFSLTGIFYLSDNPWYEKVKTEKYQYYYQGVSIRTFYR